MPILLYHSVADDGPDELAPYRVSCAAFREQMRFLVARGHYPASLEDWAGCIAANRPLPGRPVIITFDDGYRDVFANAVPVLAETGLCATIFVVAGCVGGVNDWDGEPGRQLALMDWDELRAVQLLGNTIGSHCTAHRALTKLSDEEIARDCFEAQATLRAELGREATAVATPWGLANTRVRHVLAENGYRIGVGITGGLSTLSDDVMDLPRIEIFGDDDLDAFALKLGLEPPAIETIRGRGGAGAQPPPVAVVVTSCGRQDLLVQTLDSFFAVNTAPIAQFIVVEDGAGEINAPLMETYRGRGITWLATADRVGQIAAIDHAYAAVETPFIFHMEDDWEFYRGGFIEKSLAVLEALPDCLQLWIRALDDTNEHPLCRELQIVDGVPFRKLQFGFNRLWHGFSFNPGLRRTADYRRLGQYGSFVRFDPGNPGVSEARLSEMYHRLGFYAVILADADGRGYVRHIGWGRTVGVAVGGLAQPVAMAAGAPQLA